MYSRNISSKRATRGPVPIHPERSVATTSAISASSIAGLPKTKKSLRIYVSSLPYDAQHRAQGPGVMTTYPSQDEKGGRHPSRRQQFEEHARLSPNATVKMVPVPWSDNGIELNKN